MAITDLQAAQEMAEKYPELHESRQIAFGQNYLQDLEQGTGTSQYYTGFGLAPDWVTGAIGDPYKAPVVQEPTAGDAQVAEQVAAQDRGDGITGASAVTAMTPNQAYAIPGEMPKTPVSGVWGPMDYLQDETVTPPITDQAGAVAAMTQPEAYSLPGESDPFLASGAAGGARLPATQATTTLPSGDVFATDDPMLEEKMDYTEKTPSWWESARDNFISTGRDVGNIFKDLAARGIDISKIAGSAIMNAIQPGLGLITQLPIGSASGAQQDLVKDQFVNEGVVLDDIGRIQQVGEYDTPENVMAGYAPGATGLQIGDLKIGGGTIQHSIVDRLSDLEKTKNEKYNGSFYNADGTPKNNPDTGQPTKLGQREEALKENLNTVARAAGAVTLEGPQYTKNPEAEGYTTFDDTKKAGVTTYATDYFPELGQEDTAPIDDIDEGFQTRFTAKDEGAWKGPGEISGVAGKNIVDPNRIADTTSKVGLEQRGKIDRTDAYPDYSEVTGVEPLSEIYRDQIMDIAAEQKAKENALQEELEAYRDPIMDMELPESVDLGNPLGDDRVVSEELGLVGTPQHPTMLDIAGPTIDDTKPGMLGDVGFTYDDLASQALGEALHGGDQKAEIDRGPAPNYREGPPGLSGPAPEPTPTADFYHDPITTGGGGAQGDKGGKIVCTMMNESYGFGSFRNKIWMKFHKDLSPEYQKGYHKLFLPLVKIAKTNKVVKKVLEHIAVHSTIDMRQATRGKKHLLGRVYRKILLPLCYWVGKNAKK